MTTARRPKTLLLLLVFFCWADARALGWIVFPTTSGSYHLHVALNQVWVHYAVCIVTVALAATATGYLWRPIAGWFEASLVALSVFAVSSLAGVWYTLQHLDAARMAYATGRTERGLPVSPERLAEIFTPQVLWSGAIGITAFYLLLAILAWRRRAYLPSEQSESPRVASAP
jgi:hypothetical protein